jgi:hypothetical protein
MARGTGAPARAPRKTKARHVRSVSAMTPLEPPEDHDASGVAIMHPSADQSCRKQRLSFVDRGAKTPCRCRKTHRLLQKWGVFTVRPRLRQPRNIEISAVSGLPDAVSGAPLPPGSSGYSRHLRGRGPQTAGRGANQAALVRRPRANLSASAPTRENRHGCRERNKQAVAHRLRPCVPMPAQAGIVRWPNNSKLPINGRP